MENSKQYRILEIFFRALRGENIYVRNLAEEYGVSTKSITRSINELKNFMAEHRELIGNAQLQYSYKEKCYRLVMDEFLTSKELFALLEVIIGSRAFSQVELSELVGKLKKFVSPTDGKLLNELIYKEMYNYREIKHDCESVQECLWQVIRCINSKKEVTIEYYKMDRSLVTRRIIPVSVMFEDYYFYVIAFKDDDVNTPRYFRIDRIKSIVEHRRECEKRLEFDEGLLRTRSLFMWPGPLRKIRFEFSGPSVQAVLDKIPTARIVERVGTNTYIIEAETYGDGIKMWLLSQGSWVKVVAPDDFREEMKEEIENMRKRY